MRTGSLINYLADHAKPSEQIEVGMGATEIMWTDRHAYTVIEIVNAKTLIVQQDKATRIDKNGMSESQEYSYSADPDGKKRTITLRKNGQWIAQGESLRHGASFLLGSRAEYHDYSF